MKSALFFFAALWIGLAYASGDGQVLPASTQAAVANVLPKSFAGRAFSMARNVDIRWQLTVDEVAADGTVRGKLTYPGMNCAVKDVAFVGKYDGKKFDLTIPFSSQGPECNDWVLSFTRAGEGYHFETTRVGKDRKSNRQTILDITLDPN